MAFKGVLRHNWPTIAIAVTVAAIAGAVIVVLSNMPPRMIVMATGPEGGAYHELGGRYREVLAQANVEVRLVPTAGSLENLGLLLDPHSGVDVALVQGGIMSAEDSSELESLGTLFYEPLWWFRRREIQVEGVAGLLGKKVSIGPEGSGTRALSLQLLKHTELQGKVGELLALPPQETSERLLAGEIDVAWILASWDAPVVQRLLADERVTLSGFPHADALVATYPFLGKVVVPAGAKDFAKDKPPTDVTLIAVKANLVVRKALHSAIQYLLLGAAEQIHSKSGIFQSANRFPAGEVIDIPLSNAALRFYKSGPPLLHDYLPFWIAELIGKLIILLIPILGILYPMTRFLPSLYDWAMRSKILRMYGELRFLEDDIRGARRVGYDKREVIERLDRLEEQANHIRVPVAYASMLYSLRDHIDLVRERVRRQGS